MLGTWNVISIFKVFAINLLSIQLVNRNGQLGEIYCKFMGQF